MYICPLSDQYAKIEATHNEHIQLICTSVPLPFKLYVLTKVPNSSPAFVCKVSMVYSSYEICKAFCERILTLQLDREAHVCAIAVVLDIFIIPMAKHVKMEN